MEDRDSIQPHEFAQVVAGHLGIDEDGNALGFADGPAVEQIEEDPVDDLDTDTAAEVTEDANGRLHGPDGKFVPKDGDEVEEEPEDDEDVVEEEPDEESEEDETEKETESIALDVDDPDVLAYLEKYQGDPVAALKAAVHAQSLIGRRDDERDELRKTVEELKELVVSGAAQPPPAPVNWAAEIETNPQYAAQLALHHGDADALVAAMQAWKEGTEYADPDPFGAGAFWSRLQAEFVNDEDGAAVTEQPQTDSAVDVEVAKVVKRHPDLPKYLESIGPVAAERPDLKEALENGTPQSRAQALETLYLLARGRDTDTLAKTAATAVKARTKQEARQARAGAAVVTARQSGKGGAQPTGADAFREAFRKATGLPLDNVE